LLHLLPPEIVIDISSHPSNCEDKTDFVHGTLITPTDIIQRNSPSRIPSLIQSDKTLFFFAGKTRLMLIPYKKNYLLILSSDLVRSGTPQIAVPLYMRTVLSYI
jgi:hypothetical protein